MKEDEDQLYNIVHELWHVGELALGELYCLKEINCGMFQPKEKPEYPIYFYQHQLGEVLILDETTDVIVKDKNIARWIVATNE